jgi:hypothetical protein
MKKISKILVLAIAFFLISGCTKNSDSLQPVLQPTNQLEKFDDNWPPKDQIERSIDLSDLQINELPIDVEELKEFSSLPQVGNSTIFGKVAIRLQSGHFINGLYSNVYLIPQTAYSKKWFKENYSSDDPSRSIDDKVYDFMKFTKSNQKGDFSFSNIPKGKYYIIGNMNCGVECGFESNKSIRMASELIVDKDGSVLKNIIKTL